MNGGVSNLVLVIPVRQVGGMDGILQDIKMGGNATETNYSFYYILKIFRKILKKIKRGYTEKYEDTIIFLEIAEIMNFSPHFPAAAVRYFDTSNSNLTSKCSN